MFGACFQVSRWVICLCAVAFLAPAASGETFSPPFFAFENGCRFESRAARIETLKRLGYDGIGSASPSDLATRLPLYDKAGLKIFSLYVGANLSTETPQYDPVIAAAIAQLKGRQTVIELYVQGGDGANDDRAVALVGQIADLAKQSGLKVVLYPHTGFYIDTIGDAVRIAKASQRDNVGVMFNLCHFLNVQRGADMAAAIDAARPYLWRVSINGADIDGKGWGQLIQPLDRGTFDPVPLLKQLKQMDYRGAVGLQCFGVRAPSPDHLDRSIRKWKGLLAEVNGDGSGRNGASGDDGGGD